MPTSPSPPLNPYIGLFFLVLIMVAAFANATIFSVLAPDMIAELHMTQDSVDLATTIFLALSAGLLVPMGQLADRLGRRRVLVLGALCMIGASLYGGFAAAEFDVILGRALQAPGFAMTVTTGVALLNVMFPRERPGPRGIAFGIYAASAGAGFVLGPLGGGYFSADLSWRWAFFVNVPLFLVVIAGTLWSLPASRPDPGSTSQRGAIDLGGAILLLSGLANLVFALDLGRRYGWFVTDRPLVLGGWQWPFELSVAAALTLLSIASLSVFTGYEGYRRRRTPLVLMDIELFRIRRFILGALVGFVFSDAAFALIMVLPLYLQFVLHYDALAMGITMLGLGLGVSMFGVLAAPLGKHFGARNVVVAGVVIMGGGQLTSILLLPGIESGWALQLPLFLFGAGYGMAFARINDITLIDVPKEKSGIAGGMVVAFRVVGGAVGAAVLTTVFLATVVDDSKTYVNAVPGLTLAQRQEVLDSVNTTSRSHAGNTSSGHPEGHTIAERVTEPGLAKGFAALRESYISATRITLWIGLGLSLLATLLALLIPRDAKTRTMPVGPPVEDPRYPE